METRGVLCLILLSVFGLSGCRDRAYQPASPRYIANYDYAVPPARVDVESALQASTPLRLSQIASEIQYFTVGDITFPVTQVLAVKGGFLTFNNPRTFYYKQGEKRKRYALKALAYNWNDKLDGKNLYYDKATTCVYAALNEGCKDSVVVSPYIGELPPLDTVLKRNRYLFQGMIETSFPLNAKDFLLTFSSKGYITRDTDESTGVTTGITTFNFRGDTLCCFHIGVDFLPFLPAGTKEQRKVGQYYTSYWDDDRLSFFLPYCDTVFQLRDQETIAPLYHIDFGKIRATATELTGDGDLRGKAWPASLVEGRKGLFLGIYQEGGKVYLDWWNRVDNSKPVITNQVVYLKSDDKTYTLPREKKGFINDLDDGMYFWPDGQTDEYLYMIRHASEFKDEVHLSGSPKQAKLKEFLSKLPENQLVMIVVK